MPKIFSKICNQLPLTPYVYRGEPASCDLCFSHRKLTVSQTDRRLKPLTAVACEQCGLIRTDPMPTDAELETYYAGEYRLDYQFAVARKPPSFHLKRSQREAQNRLALLEPALTGCKRILDFGSGSGEFLDLAARAGHVVQGIEPDDGFAEFSRGTYGVAVKSCFWQQAHFEPGSFDVITSNHVLEHLREPIGALKRIAEWLAVDGVLFVSVPNALAERRHSFQHFHFAHVHNFTPQTLFWAGMVAGLEPDPRFERQGTTIVFRKSRRGATLPVWGEGQGRFVAGHFQPSSPIGFLLSGRWIIDALSRLKKFTLDSRAGV